MALPVITAIVLHGSAVTDDRHGAAGRMKFGWAGKAAAAASILATAGCATLPDVTPELSQAAAERTSDPAREVALFRQWGERIVGRPFVGGNAVRIAKNGANALPALEQAIVSAQIRIDMESYEFKADEGARFGDLLLQKHAQNVQTHLIYDGWGSINAAPLTLRLRQGGVTVLDFNPIGPNPRVPIDLNQRDHRKLLVVDGKIAITGGINITDAYDKRPHPGAKNPDDMAWRDTDVVIDGPAVAQFQQLFLQTWKLQNGPKLPPAPATPPEPQGDAVVQAVDGTPMAGRPNIYRCLMVAITLAQNSVHLTTGFFVPPPDMARALEDAARRGVDVSLVLPRHSDSGASRAAGRASYGALLQAGVHIYERQGVVLHAKTAVIDGVWSAVGSSNLDWRSVLFNSEIDAVVLGRGFGDEMEAMFQGDIARSKAIDLASWSRRPLGERFDEWMATLVQRWL